MKLIVLFLLIIISFACINSEREKLPDIKLSPVELEELAFDSIGRPTVLCCVSKNGIDNMNIYIYYYNETKNIKEKVYSMNGVPIGYSDVFDSIGNVVKHYSYRYLEGFNFVINEIIYLDEEGGIDYYNSYFVENKTGDTLYINDSKIRVNFDIYPKHEKDSILVQAIFNLDTITSKVGNLIDYKFSWENENLTNGNLKFHFNLYSDIVNENGVSEQTHNTIEKVVYLQVNK